MDNLIIRLETVVGKLEGFTEKFCDVIDKTVPGSLFAAIDSLGSSSLGGGRSAGNKRQRMVDAGQLWYSPNLPDNSFPRWVVSGYEVIISGPLAKFLRASQRIGDVVYTQASMAEALFQIQYQGLVDLAQRLKPGRSVQVNFTDTLQLMEGKFDDIQKFSKQKRGPYHHHLSTISESVGAVNWMAMGSETEQFVQAMMDSGRYFSNRVLQEFRDKSSIHVDWVNAWYDTLEKLQSYVGEFESAVVKNENIKQDDDILSRDYETVTSSHSVGESKPSNPSSHFREFSVDSIVTYPRNHKVSVYPSQSAINMPANWNCSGSGMGIAPHDWTRISRGLTKRASNPETNPLQKQGFSNGNYTTHPANVEPNATVIQRVRDFSQNNSTQNQNRSNAYKEVPVSGRQKQKPGGGSEPKASPSDSDRPKKTTSQKNWSAHQEIRLKSFHHARSESQFNSSTCSFPSELRSNVSGSANFETRVAQPCSLKAARDAGDPFIAKLESQIQAQAASGQSRPAKASTTQSNPPDASNQKDSSKYRASFQTRRQDTGVLPGYTINLNPGFQPDSRSHSKPPINQGQGHSTNRSSGFEGSSSKSNQARTDSADTQRDRPTRCALEGKRWILENYSGVKDLTVEVKDENHSVFIRNCDDCIIKVSGKTNEIVFDSCDRSALVYEEIISSLKIINCQKIQAQVMAKVHSVSVDQTDGCSVILNRQSIDAQVLTSKSAAVTLLVPDENDEYKEYSIPEQFCTQWNGDQLITDDTKAANN